MDKIQSQLRRSVDQYQFLLGLALELHRALDSAQPQQIFDHAERLHEGQAALETMERELNVLLADASSDMASNPLFRQRMALLKELKDQNDLLSPRVQGIKSFAFNELSQIGGHREAMAGYKGGCKQKGKLVCRSY